MKITFEDANKSISFLERHQLEPSAINYDLALTYVVGAMPDLSREIAAQTEGGVRLTAEAANTIIDAFLIRNPRLVVSDRERAITQQAKELGALTSEAHEVTSGLERDVGTAVALSSEWPKATREFVTRLSDAERELAELRSNVAKLQAHIEIRENAHSDDGRDALTDALNRHGAQNFIDTLASIDRDYVVIMFGVDNLDELNAQFGRSVGDNTVNAFAATLRDFFQEQELIRWSGNEFVTVIKDTALRQARLIAEEALFAMAQRRLKLRGSGEWIGVVTASAGIVVSHREPATDVLNRARANLLSASALGGDRVEG